MKITHDQTSPVSKTTVPTRAIRRWLVVMDHHEARIFHTEEHGASAQQVRPHQTEAAISHTDTFNGFSRGQEKPAPATFFGPIADALKDAGEIVIFGGGTGTANEMDQFAAWMKIHRAEIAKRIVGTVVVDLHHLTDDQLLALAREFYSKLQEPAVPAL